MTDERRKSLRASIPGMRAILDGAAGERVEADVLDVGSGGLFVRSAKPLAVGKRMSLEIQGVEGVAAWSALGRVVWTRETGTTAGPPGMGVKLIDVDDAVVAAIDKLVAAHPQPPPPGRGKVPARERTVLGLGLAVAATAPPRERSVQEPPPEDWDVPGVHEAATKEIVVPQIVVQVGPAHDEAPRSELAPEREPRPAPAPEASIAVDLVARKQTEVEADIAAPRDDVPSERRDEPAVRAADVAPSEASLTAAGLPRRHGGRWLLFLLLVIAATATGLYVMRARLPWVQRLVETWTASPPAPTPIVPPSSAPTATAAPIPTPAASPSAMATPSRAPSATPTPSKAPARAAPSVRPATGDNPY